MGTGSRPAQDGGKFRDLGHDDFARFPGNPVYHALLGGIPSPGLALKWNIDHGNQFEHRARLRQAEHVKFGGIVAGDIQMAIIALGDDKKRVRLCEV